MRIGSQEWDAIASSGPDAFEIAHVLSLADNRMSLIQEYAKRFYDAGFKNGFEAGKKYNQQADEQKHSSQDPVVGERDPFFMVWVPMSKVGPTTVHNTLGKAKDEAERLAQKTGQKAVILQSLCRVKTKPFFDYKWHNQLEL